MSYILDLAKSSSPIIKDEHILESNYIPDTIVGRHKQQEEMWPPLSHLMKGQPAHHLLLMGHNGSGKTVVIRSVLRDLETVTDFQTIYLPSVRDPKSNSVMRRLLEASGVALPPKDESVASLINLLDKHLSTIDKPIIFIFDEIDFFISKDMWTVLNYIVRERDMATVVGTTNDPRLLSKIPDKKLISAYRPSTVTFPPYNTDELREILESRAEKALYANVLEAEVIPRCAALAVRLNNGDARYAISLLSKAAEICHTNLQKKVTSEDVIQAVQELENEEYDKIASLLSERHKNILRILIIKDNIRRAELQEVYETNNSYDVISDVWFARELRTLEEFGLIIRWSKGKGRGLGVTWFVSLHEDIDKEKLKEVLYRDLGGGA